MCWTKVVRILFEKNPFIFLSNKLTDFNKIIICINIKQIQTNNEKGQKALVRRKKSNRLNDMCRATGSKVMLMVLLFLVAIIQNFLIKSIIVKICKFRVS